MIEIPDTIYLQIEHDGEPADPSDWTHCADRVNDSDVEYTRDGTVRELRATIMVLRLQLGEALEGYTDEVVHIQSPHHRVRQRHV